MIKKIENYCDENQLPYSMITRDKYYEFELRTYRNKVIEDFKKIIKDKGVVKEDYECIGTNNIKRTLRIYLVKEA